MTNNGVPEFNPQLSVQPERIWLAWARQERVDRRLDVIDAAIMLGRWHPYATLRTIAPVQVCLNEYPKYDDRQFTVIVLVTLAVETGLYVEFGLKRGPLSIWAEPAVIVGKYVVRYGSLDELMAGVSAEIARLREIATRRTLGE
jgi:hypothetical protein